MRRKIGPYDTQIEAPGGPGGRGSSGGPKWMGQPRGAEPPKSKMELRGEARRASVPPPDEAARAARKKKFGIKYKAGGMVPGRSYGK